MEEAVNRVLLGTYDNLIGKTVTMINHPEDWIITHD
jgi:hypothetical protein